MNHIRRNSAKNILVFHNLSKYISSTRSITNIATDATSNTQSNPIGSNDEVEKHGRLAAEWWQMSGPMKGLHSLNELRVPFIRDGLVANSAEKNVSSRTNRVLNEFQILEVGCGGGILSESLASLHAHVTGLDLSKELIEMAKEHSQSLNENIKQKLVYKVESVEDHAKENPSKYDAVVLSEVIEHIDNKVDFVLNALQTLKIGGSIFITTPNKTLLSGLGVIGFAEYVLKAVPKGTHSFDKFISPLDMQRILNSLNCETIVINGMFYDMLSNKWTWTTNRSFCYALQAIKYE